MKLKNKKTGEIGNLNAAWSLDTLTVETTEADMPNKIVHYNSLAELCEEWEDASEEPKVKDIYFTGATVHIEMYNQKETIELEGKLKAIKRLKDKGFKFNGWNWKTQCIAYSLDYTDITEEQIKEAENDLDTCFGGEE